MKIREKLQKFSENFSNKGISYLFFLLKKFFFRIDIYLIYPFVFLMSLIIILIRPIIFIRFGSLFTAKIGPLSSIPEMNLCEKEHSIQPSKTLDIYGVQKPTFICNSQLLKMWKRVLRIWENSIFFYNVLRLLPGGRKHIIKPTNGSRDVHGLLQKSKMNLRFTAKESLNGESLLSKIGIKDKKFILMINRSQRYLKEVYDFKINFDYHSYRNNHISSFIPAAEMITKNGYTVVRAGHLVEDAIVTENKNIIDYYNKGYRTDFLDVYLASKCEYIFGSDTGYCSLPGWNFRKPILYVNFSQLEYIEPWMDTWLMIFKKYWSIKEKRFLKIDEILKSGYGRFHRSEEFKKADIELINNTEEEIVDINQEMLKRINGEWTESEENIFLQKKFWKHFEKSKLHGNFQGKIGSKFLKNNQCLFN